MFKYYWIIQSLRLGPASLFALSFHPFTSTYLSEKYSSVIKLRFICNNTLWLFLHQWHSTEFHIWQWNTNDTIQYKCILNIFDKTWLLRTMTQVFLITKTVRINFGRSHDRCNISDRTIVQFRGYLSYNNDANHTTFPVWRCTIFSIWKSFHSFIPV